jgi:hypothetical protein
MSFGKKFLFLVLPGLAALILLALIVASEEEDGLKDMSGTIVVLLLLLVVNLILYRRHVIANAWLGPANRSRMLNAVTFYGPAGQLIYYMMQIHPRDPDDVPPSDPTDVPLTDADTIAGL